MPLVVLQLGADHIASKLVLGVLQRDAAALAAVAAASNPVHDPCALVGGGECVWSRLH